MRIFFLPLFALGCILLSASLPAQSPCSSPAHAQFDFWLGEWEVFHPTADTLLGRNQITKTMNGCVVEEHWTGVHGFEGKSFNTFNLQDKSWHQTWVDQAGNTFQFAGTRQDEGMTLTGHGYTNGKAYEFEMSYTLLPSGEVRQLWKATESGKEEWSVWFDGIYRRKGD